jgi:dsDNA-specific endonuclease/ATPase MutS2
MEQHPPDEKAPVLKRLAAVREANAAAPVRVPITDSFDLHSFLPRDLALVLDAYLEEARARGFLEVRVIHGKGTGERRAHVRRLLARNGWVADFFDAPPERGGTGATVVLLKP